ncbi:MAG: chorismate synthase [Actinobacteria bacterium]|uniref:chorismate synthase n=1 Tax=freshwater metagenome TaxID=449393 RepID=A0A6J6M248_9ZZZZ|nr:chorismate synthase [Actinomycetota bacterium]MSW46809.1 chorismate synthase [Actinomycetota bacterium]MSX24509.1 chorismate synthase [Actinomycetota bacterium]MSY46669.1 chorismate synthase [Actinomycetota bacterium]MTB00193.1 chorismate synthase [Actinomycetota bacterium]
MRWLTAGESHGETLSAILEGIPASVKVESKDIDFHLARRRLGVGRGARQSFEADKISIVGGIRLGLTQGGPISISIANSEWPKWEKIMSADPVPSEEISGLARNAPLTRPRPGHADLVGMQKYDFNDARPVLERASARETAARVALGAVARAFLEQSVGITILSHVLSIGAARVPEGTALPARDSMNRIDSDPVRCADPKTSAAMIAEIELAHSEGDTLGGVIEVLVFDVPPGLGSHVHADRRLDSQLAAAVMGIQAIKGVEIGDGFLTATRRGSVAHDEIERGVDGEVRRRTDRAGGTEGGMSNGEILRVRAAMKPISTVPRALDTIDFATNQPAKAINQRSDVCAVPAAGVVAEAMVALVLAQAVLDKFGGDSVQETRRNFEAYMANITLK